MAFTYRVSTNLSPLLNIGYFKFSVNIRGLKSKKYLKDYLSQNVDSSLCDTDIKKSGFRDMINFRTVQAKHSILVHLRERKDMDECVNYCAQFGKVINVFHYVTSIQNPHLLLVEYNHLNAVHNVMNNATSVGGPECIPVITKVFRFNPKTKTLNNGQFKHEPINMYSNKYPTQVTIKESLSKTTSVADQMIKLQHLLQLHDCDVRLRFYTASQLQLCFSRLFPTLSVLPFGSSVTGFGLLKCDLDLVCTFSSTHNTHDSVSKQNLMYYYKQYSYTERGEQQQFLKLLAYIASKFIPGISNTQCILEARVPIIKFHNRLTHLYCDLSSTHLTAFHMSEILFTYGQFDPRVKPLVYTIRTWAKSQKLTNDSPGRWISNFSLTLMIIFYLQSKKILPPMKKLFSQKVNGTLKQITTSKIDLSTKSYTLYELLCDFFEYYIIFDFKIYGLCILDGVMKRKLDASPVYIFNPLEPMLNVSKNITTTELFNIKTQMQEAILAMKKDKLFNILYLLNMSPNDEGRDQKNVTSSNVATTSITSYKSVSTNRECDERENSINNVAPGEQSKSAAEEFLIETGIVDDTNKLDEIIK